MFQNILLKISATVWKIKTVQIQKNIKRENFSTSSEPWRTRSDRQTRQKFETRWFSFSLWLRTRAQSSTLSTYPTSLFSSFHTNESFIIQNCKNKWEIGTLKFYTDLMNFRACLATLHILNKFASFCNTIIYDKPLESVLRIQKKLRLAQKPLKPIQPFLSYLSSPQTCWHGSMDTHKTIIFLWSRWWKTWRNSFGARKKIWKLFLQLWWIIFNLHFRHSVI